MIKRITIFLLALMIFGCQPSMTINYDKPETSQTAILKTTVGSLNLESPEKDIDKNIGNGDYRFACICGYACYSPGFEQKDDYLTKRYGIRCLEGTSDLIESEEHGKLINTARKYTERYNQLLLKWLKENK